MSVRLRVLCCPLSPFFFSSRRRHTRSLCDWSSDVCSSDLSTGMRAVGAAAHSEGAANAVQARAMRRSALRRGWADAMRSCFMGDRKSTRLNSSHTVISYAVFCLKKKKELVQHADLAHMTYN